jgi:signal transduction histidine kinase
MEIFANATLFISVAISLVLSAIILFRGLKDTTSTLFFLISTTSALWGFGLIGFHLGLTPILGIDWLKTTHFAGVSITFFFLIFTVFFPRRTDSLKLLLPPTLLYLLNVFLVIGTDDIAASDVYGFGGAYNIGEYYILYALSTTFFLFLGSVFLANKLRCAQNQEEKNQIIYILLGAGFTSVLVFVSNLLFPYLGVFHFTWLGPIIFSLIFVGSVFVAILKHKLLNIKLVLTEVFVGVIVVLLLSEFILIESLYEFLLKGLTFVLVLFFSALLLRSVNEEIRSRERIEKLANDLKAANKQLRRMNALKTEFVSLATHQLRSPLAAIRGYVSMMLEGSYGPVDEKKRTPLERVFNATGTLAQIVQDFLDVSRVEQGNIKYDMRTFDFSNLVEEVVNERMPDIEQSKVSFSFDAPQDDVTQGAYFVYGDRSKLKQVIMNLLDNALKYTKTGLIRIQLSSDEKNVVFSITDSGMGIEKAFLGGLFQKFERADGADEVNVQGTGLGLYLARQIVEMHGGKIWAQSPGLGKGATFTVKLKRKKFS